MRIDIGNTDKVLHFNEKVILVSLFMNIIISYIFSECFISIHVISKRTRLYLALGNMWKQWFWIILNADQLTHRVCKKEDFL